MESIGPIPFGCKSSRCRRHPARFRARDHGAGTGRSTRGWSARSERRPGSGGSVTTTHAGSGSVTTRAARWRGGASRAAAGPVHQGHLAAVSSGRGRVASTSGRAWRSSTRVSQRSRGVFGRHAAHLREERAQRGRRRRRGGRAPRRARRLCASRRARGSAGRSAARARACRASGSRGDGCPARASSAWRERHVTSRRELTSTAPSSTADVGGDLEERRAPRRPPRIRARGRCRARRRRGGRG